MRGIGWWIGLALAGLAVGAAGAAERAPPRAEAPPAASDCAPGLIAVPGTRTCLRLGGRVRAEVGAGRGAATTGAAARATLDARTETELGPVRTFIQVGPGRLRP